eukprot:gene7698-9013_t
MSAHVETNDKVTAIHNFEAKPNTRYFLALTGDIGSTGTPALQSFLTTVSAKYEQVFFVSGNHEYYCPGRIGRKSMTQIDNELDALTKTLPNVHYLNNATFQIDDDLTVIGSTLWSHVPDEDVSYIQRCINDYHLILKEGTTTDSNGNKELVRITAEDSNRLHFRNVAYLEQQIALVRQQQNKRAIVLTHHAPLFSDAKKNHHVSHPRYIDGQNNVAFNSDQSALMGPPVHAWIYGHTHWCSMFKHKGTLVATNQVGYVFEQGVEFNPNQEIDLDN